MEYLGEAGTVGIFAIFALMVIERILEHRKTLAWKNGNGNGSIERRKNPPPNCPISQDMAAQISTLHELHTVRDSDGVTPLARVAQQSREQTKLLRRMADALDAKG